MRSATRVIDNADSYFIGIKALIIEFPVDVGIV